MRTSITLLSGLLVASAASAADPVFGPPALVLNIATATSAADEAGVTDVEIEDLDGDGSPELLVTWFITDEQNRAAGQRYLTIYTSDGAGGLARLPDIDLFIFDSLIEQLSIFRNGPGEIAIGDFDGDNDPDIAVLPYFGDELWLLENAGGLTFNGFVEFMFGFNSTGDFQTPPEAGAADFNGDGRDELVYVSDPIFPAADGFQIHFWSTDTTVGAMQRVLWNAPTGDFVRQIRGMALADFSGDGDVDIAFVGSLDPQELVDPIVELWTDLNPLLLEFQATSFAPADFASDILAVWEPNACTPTLMLSDRGGSLIDVWRSPCGAPLAYNLDATVTGYVPPAQTFGMALVAHDLDGDGDEDVISRQRGGAVFDASQVEAAVHDGSGVWGRIDPTPFDSTGFAQATSNQILRPRAIAAGNLLGDAAPEVAVGFSPPLTPGGDTDLLVAIWSPIPPPPVCAGDVDGDRDTDSTDLALLLGVFGTQLSEPGEHPADLDLDAQVSSTDLAILLGDFGCIDEPS